MNQTEIFFSPAILAIIVSFGLMFLGIFIKHILFRLVIIASLIGVIFAPELNNGWIQTVAVALIIFYGFMIFKERREKNLG